MKEPNPNYKVSRCEQETCINWSAADSTAQIYSLNPVVTRKMDKLSKDFPDVYKCTSRVSDGGEWEMPAKFIRFGKPPSPAQSAAARERWLSRIDSVTSSPDESPVSDDSDDEDV